MWSSKRSPWKNRAPIYCRHLDQIQAENLADFHNLRKVAHPTYQVGDIPGSRVDPVTHGIITYLRFVRWTTKSPSHLSLWFAKHTGAQHRRKKTYFSSPDNSRHLLKRSSQSQQLSFSSLPRKIWPWRCVSWVSWLSEDIPSPQFQRTCLESIARVEKMFHRSSRSHVHPHRGIFTYIYPKNHPVM